MPVGMDWPADGFAIRVNMRADCPGLLKPAVAGRLESLGERGVYRSSCWSAGQSSILSGGGMLLLAWHGGTPKPALPALWGPACALGSRATSCRMLPACWRLARKSLAEDKHKPAGELLLEALLSKASRQRSTKFLKRLPAIDISAVLLEGWMLAR